MRAKFIYMTNFLLVLCLLSCSKPDTTKLIGSSKGLILTQTEIKGLLPLLGAPENSKSNFHVLYTEQFNDSTCLIRVYLSNHLANEKLGVCEVFEFNQSKVFVYDSTNCKLDLPDSLTTSKEHVPFMNDGLLWMVLAKRRGGHIQYYNVTFFNNPEDEMLKDLVDPLNDN